MSAALISDGSAQARWSYVMTGLEQVSGPATGMAAPGAHLMSGTLSLYPYAWNTDHAPDPAWPQPVHLRLTRAVVFDHHQRRAVALGCGQDTGEAEQRAHQIADLITSSGQMTPSRRGALAESFTPEQPDTHYLDSVRAVVAAIEAGEIFQANIARAWSGALASGVRPLDVFARLLKTSPAPYAAYLDLGERALVSNSPETFLEVEASSGTIRSRPIKGTRPRETDPAADAAAAAELAASAKDRAENLMIVDLMRNDLARVCEAGSVSVPELHQVHSYANVHHLVSTVEGQLRPGAGVEDIMRASFPPGSITGAPKHQAMRVIARHEGTRGPWCGALVLAGDDGALSASVLIRTLAFTRGQGRWLYRTLAGAGIVADSVAEHELAETEAKISAIARALRAP